jgi:hypothetical protein
VKIARTIAGFCLFAAFIGTGAMSMSCINRLRIYYQREQYKPAVFFVDDAEFHPSQSAEGPTYWLNGTIEGRTERFIPEFPPNFSPTSAKDLLAIYPRAKRIDVLYNPAETETIIQGETLRVLQAKPNFWAEEEQLRNRLLLWVCIPVPATLMIYLVLRFLDGRRDRQIT